ncbi:MAG: hypothetical protein WCO97_09600, partial [bacterium]
LAVLEFRGLVIRRKQAGGDRAEWRNLHLIGLWNHLDAAGGKSELDWRRLVCGWNESCGRS